MAEAMMQKMNPMGTVSNPLANGKNATTAIEKYVNVTTPYLKNNDGYAKIVGVQFKDNPKVYDYIDLKGTVRTGDSPNAEVTNKWSGENTVIPSKYTKVVNTGKSGIARNEQRLDKVTNKGINLKVIDSKALKGQVEAQKEAKMQRVGLNGEPAIGGGQNAKTV